MMCCNEIFLEKNRSNHFLLLQIATMFFYENVKKLIKNSKKFVYYNENMYTNCLMKVLL